MITRRHATAWGLWAALLATPALSHAWGWTQPRGAHYLRVWNRSIFGARGYFADGTARALEPGAGFGDHALNYYLEVGLTDRWTLVSYGRPVGYAVHRGEGAVYMGDLNVGLRRGLLRGTWNLAAEIQYGAVPPVGDVALGGASRGADMAPYVYQPTVATHRFAGELQLGRPVGSGGWITAQVGARAFTSSDLAPVAIYGGLQFGWQFRFGLTASASVLTNQPIGSGTGVSNISGAGVTRYVGFAVDLSYWFTPRWAITAGIGGAFVAESNAAALPILFGFEHR